MATDHPDIIMAGVDTWFRPAGITVTLGGSRTTGTDPGSFGRTAITAGMATGTTAGGTERDVPRPRESDGPQDRSANRASTPET